MNIWSIDNKSSSFTSVMITFRICDLITISHESLPLIMSKHEEGLIDRVYEGSCVQLINDCHLDQWVGTEMWLAPLDKLTAVSIWRHRINRIECDSHFILSQCTGSLLATIHNQYLKLWFVNHKISGSPIWMVITTGCG